MKTLLHIPFSVVVIFAVAIVTANADQPSLPSGAALSFKAKPIGLLTISSTWVDAPYHFWLVESVDPKASFNVKYWVVDCKTLQTKLQLKGKKFTEGSLRGSVQLRIQVDQSERQRRFLAAFLADTTVMVRGTFLGDTKESYAMILAPDPTTLPNTWSDSDVYELDEKIKLHDSPVIYRATVEDQKPRTRNAYQ